VIIITYKTIDNVWKMRLERGGGKNPLSLYLISETEPMWFFVNGY
jgi:hypothetical protein